MLIRMFLWNVQSQVNELEQKCGKRTDDYRSLSQFTTITYITNKCVSSKISVVHPYIFIGVLYSQTVLHSSRRPQRRGEISIQVSDLFLGATVLCYVALNLIIGKGLHPCVLMIRSRGMSRKSFWRLTKRFESLSRTTFASLRSKFAFLVLFSFIAYCTRIVSNAATSFEMLPFVLLCSFQILIILA